VEPLDVLRIALRWVHLTSAVVWVGGTLFYVLVLRPSLEVPERAAAWETLREPVERGFHEVVQLCIWAFFITGALLTYDRLTSTRLGLSYFAVLAVKVALAVWMVYVSGGLSRTGARRPLRAQQNAPHGAARGLRRLWRSPTFQIVVAGVTVLLLADVLKILAENALRSR